MDKITFVIPCYNNLHHTEKCVKSIRAHSPPGSFNFVFVNNGSTDGTKKYLENVPDSIVINNPQNIYVNPAWNQAFDYILNHDIGDYVCLCNNDIEASENWLDEIFKLFRQNRQEWFIPMTLNYPEFKKHRETFQPTNLRLSKIEGNFVGFCMFFRKEHIKHFYPIPSQLLVLRGDDWITDCISFHNVVCFVVHNCVVHHFGSATQRILSINPIKDSDAREFDKLVATEYKNRGMKRIFQHKFQIGLL